MPHENYKILQNINAGRAVAGKFNSQKLLFKKPNIVVVFSNTEPDKSNLSSDQWKIFTISKDLENLEEKGVKYKKSKEFNLKIVYEMKKEEKKNELWRPCDTSQVNIEMNNEQQGMFVEEEDKCEKEKNIQPCTSNDMKN